MRNFKIRDTGEVKATHVVGGVNFCTGREKRSAPFGPSLERGIVERRVACLQDRAKRESARSQVQV